MTPHPRPRREGVAAVELAILLPFLVFIFAIAVDWSRFFYYSMIVETCARNGALYASDPYAANQSPYANMTAAALADASDVSPQPTVTTDSGVDSTGTSYVDCTVSYTFQSLTNVPGVPTNTQIVRTVRVYQAPQVPK
jgi:Flp pilus assembly protein TadG